MTYSLLILKFVETCFGLGLGVGLGLWLGLGLGLGLRLVLGLNLFFLSCFLHALLFIAHQALASIARHGHDVSTSFKGLLQQMTNAIIEINYIRPWMRIWDEVSIGTEFLFPIPVTYVVFDL